MTADDELPDDHPFKPVALVPVADWVWHKWLIRYWADDPAQGGRLLYGRYLVSTDSHVEGRVMDRGGSDDTRWMTWNIVEERVPAPPAIGHLYGSPIIADGWDYAVAEIKLGDPRLDLPVGGEHD